MQPNDTTSELLVGREVPKATISLLAKKLKLIELLQGNFVQVIPEV
jgi:hypothetical protein